MTPVGAVAGTVAALMLSATALGIDAAVGMPRTLMARADYNTAMNAIEYEMRVSFAGCRLQPEPKRPLCRAQARTDARIQAAELRARYYGTVQAAESANRVRAEAGMELERARRLGTI